MAMITTFDAGRPKSGKSDMNGVYETNTNRGKYDKVSIPKHTRTEKLFGCFGRQVNIMQSNQLPLGHFHDRRAIREVS